MTRTYYVEESTTLWGMAFPVTTIAALGCSVVLAGVCFVDGMGVQGVNCFKIWRSRREKKCSDADSVVGHTEGHHSRCCESSAGSMLSQGATASSGSTKTSSDIPESATNLAAQSLRLKLTAMSKEESQSIDNDDDLIAPLVKKLKDNPYGNGDNGHPITIVVQRFRSASLLIKASDSSNPAIIIDMGDNNSLRQLEGGIAELYQLVPSADKNEIESISQAKDACKDFTSGIAVYISFGISTKNDMIDKAAKAVLNLPILTNGLWGDGTKAISVLKCASELEKKCNENARLRITNDETSNMIYVVAIPQANLICKVKNKGKSIQYRDQIDKKRGEELFHMFVKSLKSVVSKDRQEVVASLKCVEIPTASGNRNVTDPSIPPKDVFRDDAAYSSYDDGGFPLADSEGSDLDLESSWVLPVDDTPNLIKVSDEKKSDDVVTIVQGTFGQRQGFEFCSDMGPFCHVINTG